MSNCVDPLTGDPNGIKGDSALRTRLAMQLLFWLEEKGVVAMEFAKNGRNNTHSWVATRLLEDDGRTAKIASLQVPGLRLTLEQRELATVLYHKGGGGGGGGKRAPSGDAPSERPTSVRRLDLDLDSTTPNHPEESPEDAVADIVNRWFRYSRDSYVHAAQMSNPTKVKGGVGDPSTAAREEMWAELNAAGILTASKLSVAICSKLHVPPEASTCLPREVRTEGRGLLHVQILHDEETQAPTHGGGAIIEHRAATAHADTELLLVTLPETGGKQETQWVFCRSLEYLLYGTETNASNLLHALQELELDSAVRHLQASTIDEYGMSRAQLATVMSLFNQW